MFQFQKEQIVCEAGGVKFGGHPGDIAICFLEPEPPRCKP